MKTSAMQGLRAATIVMVAGLAACSSTGDTDISAATVLAGGRDLAAEQESLQRFAVVAICPQVQVRDGTQLIRIFEPGKQDDLTAVRFQGTITKFSRECRTDPATGATTIRLGVAGRLLSGPNGATGTVDLPLRVVEARNGDEVIYSKLFKVPATVTKEAPAFTWAQVVEDIVVPAEQSSGQHVIYVGFDEGSPSS